MTTSIIYGLYAAAVGIVVTLIGYFAGLSPEAAQASANIGTLAVLVCIYLAIKERRDEDFDGQITTGQGMGTGMVVGAVSALVMTIFMFVYVTRINPDFIEHIRESGRQQMAQNANMTAAQREQGEKVMDFFSSPAIIAVATFLMGLIFALCASWTIMVRKIGYVFAALFLIFAAFSAMGPNKVSLVTYVVFAAILITAEILSDRWRFPKAQPERA